MIKPTQEKIECVRTICRILEQGSAHEREQIADEVHEYYDIDTPIKVRKGTLKKKSFR